MRKLLFIFLLFALPAFPQGFRIGDNAPITSSLTTPGQLSTVTSAIINICASPANAVPCTNRATTYTSVTLGTPCSTSTQVVLSGTNSCIGTTDVRGNWGAWVAAGNYDWTVTVSTGQSFGPFTVSAGVPSGTNLSLGSLTTTGVVNANGPGYFGSGSPWIDVKSSLYGAKCDGVTDDATAVNAASTAASSSGVGSSSLVYLPTGNCDVKSQIVVKQHVVFRGEDEGSNIVADSTFPVSTPLMQVGNVALNDVTRIEHVTVDCNGVTGCTGATTTTAQEMSGADYVTFRRTNVFCVDVEGNSQNSIWSNSQCGSSTLPPATWEGFRINTNSAVKTTIFNVSIVPTGAGGTACIHDVLGVLLAYAIHCENVTDGVRFDASSFGAVHGMTGGANITNTVKLNAATGAVFLTEIEKNGGTNTINDVDCGVVLSTDNVIPFYAHSHGGAKCAWLDSTGFNATSIKTPGQITSTLATGTAPLSIASTTPVPNLTVQNCSSCAIASVTNSAGLQLFNTTTTCTTGAAVGATCTTAAITLPVGNTDTNYRPQCTGIGPTNVPIVETIAKSSATQFTITIAALTAAAATFTSYDCTVGHN